MNLIKNRVIILLLINRRELQFLLVGVLLTAGAIFLYIGLKYKVDPVLVLQSVTIPPVFNIPNEVNRDFVIDIIDGTNIERKKAGLNPLKENSALDYAAYLRAKDILTFQDFSHEATKSGNKNVVFVSKVVGYRYSNIGENLALSDSDPNEVIAGWLNSPKHKDNLLSKDFDEIGVTVLSGAFQGTDFTYITVQLLGKQY